MNDPDETYDDDVRAAEYVLHLMDVDERRAFEVALADDPELRRRVTHWETHFAAIADEVPEATPPARIKSALMAKIAPQKPKTSRLFKWLGGIAAAAVVSVLAFNVFAPTPGALSPSFQAELQSSEGEVVLVAGVIPATHEIVIEPFAQQAPEGRDLQLWLIAAADPTPVPLGLIARDGQTRIVVPDDIAPGVRTGTIAISDEPPGGSPTGAPTGAVLATGTFVDIE